MKLLLLCFLGVAISAAAQPSPYRVLQPIMKNPNQRNAPSSVTDKDLDGGQPAQQTSPQVVLVIPPKPTEIVAKIDADFAISKVNLIARVSGLKGSIYVTNISAAAAVPHVQFAVCDSKGYQIGVASVVGPALGPSSDEKLSVVATNSGSADLKLMKLSAK